MRLRGSRDLNRAFFATAHSASHKLARCLRCSVATQRCHISAPMPSTQSSSSTLHARLLKASLHSLVVTQSPAERVQCATGTIAGMEVLSH